MLLLSKLVEQTMSNLSTDMRLHSLDIESVDFTDPVEIRGFVSHLCHLADDAGVSAPDFMPTRESSEIRSLAGKVVNKLDKQLPQMTVAEAFNTLSAYDFAHRLAYRTPADRKFINKIALRAFDAMIHGDKTVDEYEMYRHIRRCVALRDKDYLDKPLKWTCISLEYWYKEASRAYEHSALTDYDIINRVNILLESDLYAYEGHNQHQFKHHLVEQHRHYLDKYVATDRKTHSAAERFRDASGRHILL